jgi:hypothetical protein
MPKKIKAKELLGLVNVVDMGFVEVNVNKYKVSKYLNIYNPIAMKN